MAPSVPPPSPAVYQKNPHQWRLYTVVKALAFRWLRVNSSFEAATGIGMGSNHKVPLSRARLPTPDSCTYLSSRSSPKGRVLTLDPTILEEPAQIWPAQLARRKHRRSSISASEKSLEILESDGEGRRMEKRARFERNTGPLDERMQGVNTLRARQDGDGDPFRTPELRVVNIDV